MVYPKARMAALTVAIALALSSCSFFKSSNPPNDGAIVSSIQSKLFQDPVLKTRDVRVVSQQGVVVLTGTVGSDQEKSAVEQIAHSTDGVKQVIDELTVGSPPEAAAQAPEAPAQPEPRRLRRRERTTAQSESPSESAPTPAPVVQSPPESATAPASEPSAPPQPVEITVPAGTVITVRTVDPVDSSTNQVGDEFSATIDSPVSEDGQIAIPRYAKARLKLVSVRNAGHIKGRSEVQLQLVSVTVGGKTYVVDTGTYQQEASSSRGKQTAERAGIGAAIGGIIGAIAGGGKGAAIGAGVGAGAGTGVQMATKAQAVKIPPETKIDFTLRSPLRVTVNQ